MKILIVHDELHAKVIQRLVGRELSRVFAVKLLCEMLEEPTHAHQLLSLMGPDMGWWDVNSTKSEAGPFNRRPVAVNPANVSILPLLAERPPLIS